MGFGHWFYILLWHRHKIDIEREKMRTKNRFFKIILIEWNAFGCRNWDNIMFYLNGKRNRDKGREIKQTEGKNEAKYA